MIAENRTDGAHRQEFSSFNDGHMRADFFHFIEHVAGEDDGFALGGDSLDDAAHFDPTGWQPDSEACEEDQRPEGQAGIPLILSLSSKVKYLARPGGNRLEATSSCDSATPGISGRDVARISTMWSDSRRSSPKS